MTKPNYIFKAGDRVSWCGMRGTVGPVSNNEVYAGAPYPIKVMFDDGDMYLCTEDGRFHKEQIRPVLKLLKKKKRESVDGWVHEDIFEGHGDCLYMRKPNGDHYVRVRITKIRDEK